MEEIKYIRVQLQGHTVVEFRNGSRICSCQSNTVRGESPNLRDLEEIEYKNLSLGQKTLADAVLAAYKTCHKWGRQSGRTHLNKYLVQELLKLRNNHDV